MNRSGYALGLLLVLLVLGGCGSVLSRDALYGVNYEVDYAQIKAAPENHEGKTVIAGGMILANQLSEAGTTLEILKYTLDSRDEPQDPDEVNGRFLARTSRLLDPSIYKAGRLVTLVVTLRGLETRPLQKIDYRYPVFEVVELYLVPERQPEGRGYYPYYYDPWPYWHRYPYWYRHPYWW
ncbi:MAG: Slp family lipoprotein [Syntrophotaleaceae bacterium]